MKKSASFKEHELAKLKHDIKQLAETAIDYKKLNTTAIQVGDVVTVIPFQRDGIVMKAMGSGNFQIQMGTITPIFHQNQLEYAGKKPIKTDMRPKSPCCVSPIPKVELDLRGMRFEEAMTALDKFLDNCPMERIPRVRLHHPRLRHGSALRKGVHGLFEGHLGDRLATVPGGEGEGGSGGDRRRRSSRCVPDDSDLQDARPDTPARLILYSFYAPSGAATCRGVRRALQTFETTSADPHRRGRRRSAQGVLPALRRAGRSGRHPSERRP
ncbi:MAG: Smr/MutS family protein [Anaerotruncus sp.]|nr:Smr/MutS family protein [Anaerotruncus sp.]